MWRVSVPGGADVVVRLPRRAGAAQAIGQELDLLRSISDSALAKVVDTPAVRHDGAPDEAFPHRWAVLGWLDGSDAWTARDDLDGGLDDLAIDLAHAVRAIGGLRDVPAPRRCPGDRGGPVEPLLRSLDRWLDDARWNAGGLVDVASVRRSAAESLEAAGEPVTVGFVHGDLIPGNVLTRRGRLTALIDWGTAAYADPAQDLAPAWALFDRRSRPVFREAVGADDAAWLRARAFELEHAVGGVLYYVPRRHPLGDVMACTLHRILEEG
jgi:aminoglycoside phosphotransferase (APT) family kinase protein